MLPTVIHEEVQRTYTLLKDIASNGHRQHNVAGVVISKSSPKQVDSSKGILLQPSIDLFLCAKRP